MSGDLGMTLKEDQRKLTFINLEQKPQINTIMISCIFTSACHVISHPPMNTVMLPVLWVGDFHCYETSVFAH